MVFYASLLKIWSRITDWIRRLNVLEFLFQMLLQKLRLLCLIRNAFTKCRHLLKSKKIILNLDISAKDNEIVMIFSHPVRRIQMNKVAAYKISECLKSEINKIDTENEKIYE